MKHEVHVSQDAASKIARSYGLERTTSGFPSEWDFWSGPLQAALVRFRGFDSLPYHDDPEIRHLHIVDPVFGVVVFVGVLTKSDRVDIVDFDVDHDYWDMIQDDPDD